MKKKLLSALFFAMGFCSLNAQMVEDFEAGLGSVSNLTFRNQNSAVFNILDCQLNPLFGNPLFPTFIATNVPNQRASVVSSGNMEPILASYGISQDVVGPNGGRFAIRLNDVLTGGQDISSFEQTFTPTDTHLSFDYMLVLDSDHINQLPVQPFFTARLLDSQDNLIQATQFCLVADPADPILINNNNQIFFTKGWYCGLINIPHEFIGQQIKVQFVTADCGAGAHTGVAYIDNIVNAKKCDHPQYGYIDLDPQEYECSPKKATVCGTYSAPQNSTLNTLDLKLMQNGVGVGINPAAITLISLTADTFCFHVDFGIAGIPLSGGYEFRVDATFISNVNGYVHTLADESTMVGSDVSFGGGPAPVTYIDFYNTTISWPDTGGPYYIEFAADDACCPGSYIQPPNTTSGSMTTFSNSISFYDGIMMVQRKCLRFRIKTECSDWSQWCCITSYGESEGGYTIPAPGESFDCVDEYSIDNPQPRPAYVYPNATTGNITIKNSNSLSFELYDYSNNLVLSKKISEIQEEVVLDLHSLKQGIYILKTEKGHTIKVIKN